MTILTHIYFSVSPLPPYVCERVRMCVKEFVCACAPLATGGFQASENLTNFTLVLVLHSVEEEEEEE